MNKQIINKNFPERTSEDQYRIDKKSLDIAMGWLAKEKDKYYIEIYNEWIIDLKLNIKAYENSLCN